MEPQSEKYIILRLDGPELTTLGLSQAQKQYIDSLKSVIEVASRKSQSEILKQRYINMGLHFVESGSAQVGLPKKEIEKYHTRVMSADIYPVYTAKEMVDLIVSEEIKPGGPTRPIFIVVPKEGEE